jgi:hypothetical protein
MVSLRNREEQGGAVTTPGPNALKQTKSATFRIGGGAAVAVGVRLARRELGLEADKIIDVQPRRDVEASQFA